MEAIIFDVDGTLWDAKDEIVYSWNLALEGWPQITKRLTGVPDRESVDRDGSLPCV